VDLRLRGLGGQALSFIRATWCTSGNVGDRITPWLVRKMTGQPAVYVDHRDPIPKVLGCGSILAWSSPTTTVWGAGILSADDQVHPLADIRAVRGPLSRARALACGAECPEVYGDPGWLVPRYLPHARGSRYHVGLVPHYVDQFLVDLPKGWRYLSVFDSFEDFVADLCECEVIVSSALHGIVLADAYGIPSLRMVMGDRIGGDGTKFIDYEQATHRASDRTVPWRHIQRGMPIDVIQRLAEVGQVDVEPLLAACPFAREA
jgi:pyruvyltransferase